MALVRFRLTGSRADADTVITMLHGIEGIEHVEDVDDLMAGMRDDSSSSESASDSEAGLYAIEVDAPTQKAANRVRESADMIARELNAGIEFTDAF
jgi:hypothetical protein